MHLHVISFHPTNNGTKNPITSFWLRNSINSNCQKEKNARKLSPFFLYPPVLAHSRLCLFYFIFFWGPVFKGSSFPPKREYLITIEMYFSINFQLTVCRFVAQKRYIFSLKLYVCSVYRYRGSDTFVVMFRTFKISYVQKYIRDIGLILPRSLNIGSCYFYSLILSKSSKQGTIFLFQFVTYSADFY